MKYYIVKLGTRSYCESGLVPGHINSRGGAVGEFSLGKTHKGESPKTFFVIPYNNCTIILRYYFC